MCLTCGYVSVCVSYKCAECTTVRNYCFFECPGLCVCSFVHSFVGVDISVCVSVMLLC